MITARVIVRGASWRRAITMPPMIMSGAPTITVRAMATIICTCWTSLVFLVMRDGAPKRFISCCEKLSTLRNREPRTSRPKAIATFDPQ